MANNHDNYGNHNHRLCNEITLEAVVSFAANKVAVARNLSNDTGEAYKEMERLEKIDEDSIAILQMAEESCKTCKPPHSR